MPEPQGTIIAALMEQLIQTGPEGMAQAFTALFNLAMRLERERHLGAEAYERNAERRGYANGYKPKTLDTPAGTVTVQVPKPRDTAEPFFPQSLERGRRSCRDVMLAIAEMYVQGVSTRDAAKVMAEFGLKNLSSMQVSRAAALLDEELQAWRARPLSDTAYLLLDARYEKVREGGVVRDVAILSAIGIGPDGRRRVLGVSATAGRVEFAYHQSRRFRMMGHEGVVRKRRIIGQGLIEGRQAGALRFVEYTPDALIDNDEFFETMDADSESACTLAGVLCGAWECVSTDVSEYGPILEFSTAWMALSFARGGLWAQVGERVIERISPRHALLVMKAFPLEYEEGTGRFLREAGLACPAGGDEAALPASFWCSSLPW